MAPCHPLLSQDGQELEEWHLYRTNVCAGSAQRGGIEQRVRSIHAVEESGKHNAHWPRIGGTVSMPSNGSIYRTYVETHAASDAFQDLATLPGQDFRASIIQQDYVELFGSGDFPGFSSAGYHGKIA